MAFFAKVFALAGGRVRTWSARFKIFLLFRKDQGPVLPAYRGRPSSYHLNSDILRFGDERAPIPFDQKAQC
jgi:hypothetical protein